MRKGITRKRTYIAVLVISVFAIVMLAGGFFLKVRKDYSIKVAILYSGSSGSYLDIYQYFSQPLLMNLKVTKIDADKIDADGLASYDLIYPDISVKDAANSEKIKKLIMDYASGGGAVFLENGFYNWFPQDFLGAASFKSIGKLPDNLEFPEVRYDLKPIQRLIGDYYEIFRKFRKQDEIKADYGFGMIADTAVPIVNAGDTALYTLNYYGNGYVFFTNGLLPGKMFINGFDMTPRADSQVYFNNTAAAAHQMLESEYAAFVSKQKYGYALKRVFGPYGRPAMAWQNHFEVLSAIEQGSMEKWVDITREYNQIPSYSLARGVYEWATRYESIGYFINKDEGKGLSFEAHQEEAFYAAGKHPVVDNWWLVQKKSDTSYGYFVDIGDLPDRAYPYVEDLNGDGIMDIVSGSSDGFFYFYKGLKYEDRWILDKPARLSAANGREISVDGFSSPVLYDLNGDGYKDLISGSDNGKVFWFSNNGSFYFIPEGQLVKTADSAKLSAPDVGDLDGDGVPDLVIGTKDGTVYFYKGIKSGKKISFKSGVPLKNSDGGILNAGTNAAPRLVDLDGDGRLDMAAGTYEGYIRKFKNSGIVNGVPSLSDEGYFDDSVPNYLGNLHIKSGNNAVPAFADLDGDKKLDMITGRLEFGMAVAIDSPWFPYREELTNALKYLEENYVSIQPHIYTNHYIDSAAEQRELEMHKKAFEAYGLEWEGTGSNQHTWKINILDPLQTLMNEYNSGLLWNSGFEQVNSGLDPANGTESTWLIPFYLIDKSGEATNMIIFNPSPLPEDLWGMYRYSAAWDTPVSVYQHSEYDTIRNPEKLRKRAEFLDKFRNEYDYNFMTEEQMVKSFAAALNTSVEIGINPVKQFFYMVQNKIRTLQQFEIFIEPDVITEGRKLLDGPYKNVAGVKVEAGEKYLSAPLDTDADIYFRKGRDLYIGLNRPVRVYVSKKPNEKTHIERINLPAQIVNKDNGMNISFLDGGMQQIKFYVPNNDLKVDGSDWKVENAGDREYILTRFGGPTELKLSFSK